MAGVVQTWSKSSLVPRQLQLINLYGPGNKANLNSYLCIQSYEVNKPCAFLLKVQFRFQWCQLSKVLTVALHFHQNTRCIYMVKCHIHQKAQCIYKVQAKWGHLNKGSFIQCFFPDSNSNQVLLNNLAQLKWPVLRMQLRNLIVLPTEQNRRL